MLQIDLSIWGEEEKLDDEDNEVLCRPFSEEEVKNALFSMNNNRAPGPDNIPAEFYQHFWDIMKKYIMRLFTALYEGTLDVHRLNYGIITLLPKINGANKIQQFRPICLLRCPYKLITKVLDNRVTPYMLTFCLANIKMLLSNIGISWMGCRPYMRFYTILMLRRRLASLSNSISERPMTRLTGTSC